MRGREIRVKTKWNHAFARDTGGGHYFIVIMDMETCEWCIILQSKLAGEQDNRLVTDGSKKRIKVVKKFLFNDRKLKQTT